MGFKGKVAIITGGGGGIGHGYALPVLKNGMKLVLADINKDRLDAMKARLEKEVPGSEIATWQGELSSLEANKELCKFAFDTFGGVDMVFLNAGIHFHKNFFLMTDNDWEFIIRCNLYTVLNGARVFVPVLKDNPEGGNLITTGSGASIGFAPTMGHYMMVKHAVLGLSGSIQTELDAMGIKNVLITCVMPDFVSSNLMSSVTDVRAAMGLNNPEEPQTDVDKYFEKQFTDHVQAVYDGLPKPDDTVITNEEAGEVVWKGILDKKNFVLTHEGRFSTGKALGEQVDSGYVSSIIKDV